MRFTTAITAVGLRSSHCRGPAKALSTTWQSQAKHLTQCSCMTRVSVVKRRCFLLCMLWFGVLCWSFWDRMSGFRCNSGIASILDPWRSPKSRGRAFGVPITTHSTPVNGCFQLLQLRSHEQLRTAASLPSLSKIASRHLRQQSSDCA